MAVDPKRYRLSYVTVRAELAAQEVMLESAKGAAPSLVHFIVSQSHKGSWWALPNSNAIYNVLTRVREDPGVLVCKMLGGKITLIDQRLWHVFAALYGTLPKGALDRVVETHQASGQHSLVSVALQDWLPGKVKDRAVRLGPQKAFEILNASHPNLCEALKPSAISPARRRRSGVL